MTDAPEVSVVAPLHGNAATLVELVARTRASLDPRAWELILVDDASPDGAGDLAQDIARDDSRVRTCAHTRRMGQAEALRSGTLASRGRRVAFLDADLQDPPEVLPRLLAAGANVALVFGIRHDPHRPWPRRFSSALYKAIRSRVCGVPRGAGLLLLGDGDLLRGVALRAPRPCWWIPLLGATSCGTAAVAVEREPRPSGASAYRGLMRWRVGLSELAFALRLRFGLIRLGPQPTHRS